MYENVCRELQHLWSGDCVDQSAQSLHPLRLSALSHVRGNELGKQAGPGSFSAKQPPSNNRPLMTSYLYNFIIRGSTDFRGKKYFGFYLDCKNIIVWLDCKYI